VIENESDGSDGGGYSDHEELPEYVFEDNES
jgi:hypothetical protein